MRNDFAGEIKIFKDGKPHLTINYSDFDSFAWSPGKDEYGPVYHFKVDGSDTKYSFKPAIRGKKASTYSFFLQRVKKTFWQTTVDSMKGRKQATPNTQLGNSAINIPAVVGRIDMDLEQKGVHAIYIGSRHVFQGGHDSLLLRSALKNNYDGFIKVYKNDRPFLMILYNDYSSAEGVGSGPYSPWDNYDYRRDGRTGYTFNIAEPGIYSFIPAMRMKSEKDFEFSVYIASAYIRK